MEPRVGRMQFFMIAPGKEHDEHKLKHWIYLRKICLKSNLRKLLSVAIFCEVWQHIENGISINVKIQFVFCHFDGVDTSCKVLSLPIVRESKVSLLEGQSNTLLVTFIADKVFN